MSNLTVAVIQSDITWENKEKNYQHFAEQIKAVDDSVNLIVLPEMFNVGFSANIKAALTEKKEIIKWMQTLSKQKKAAIIGSVITLNDSNQPVNRLYFVNEDGEIHHYDKRHLFVLSDEAKCLTAGNKRVIVKYKGFRILLSICFDLRFPVFNCNQKDYDLLVNIASWPASRADHWRTLAKARAIENQSYVVTCNRIGKDGNNLEYSGDSLCIHFDGNIKQDIPKNTPDILLHTFEKAPLDEYRQKFRVLDSQDKFELTMEHCEVH